MLSQIFPLSDATTTIDDDKTAWLKLFVLFTKLPLPPMLMGVVVLIVQDYT
jgi:hypothetical protein